MIDRYDNRTVNKTGYGVASGVDQGLRSYMLKVYNFMSLGLLITGLVSYFVAQSSELMHLLYATPLKWVVLLAPIGVVLLFSYNIASMSVGTARAVFWAYSGLMGLSLASIFMLYTGQSIAKVFFITASLFASMSLYGYTTKKDLTSMGSFMIMGVWGIVIAGLVNLFFQSPAMSFVISVLGVIIFTGLTAYDTQNIKDMYYQVTHEGDREKVAVMGALQLYLDFINLFISLLRLFGDRR